MEGNDSITHTEKFKKWENPSRARDSHIAILAYPDKNQPYIDFLRPFVSPQNYFMLCVTNERLKRRSENVLRAPQDRLKKQGTQAVATSHNRTINNKLNLHYLLYLFQLRRKKKSNLVQNVFLYSQILRRAE